jgi:hypothetical protein
VWIAVARSELVPLSNGLGTVAGQNRKVCGRAKQ